MHCICVLFCFFFFKQKTAYEIRLSLVGSEMCIRDSMLAEDYSLPVVVSTHPRTQKRIDETDSKFHKNICLLYTSDAVDE